MYKVCIDPGHGGKDPGASAGGWNEKEIVLEIGKLIHGELLNRGYKTFMTRSSDIYETPYQKAQKANTAGADYFVSIHCNAADSTAAQGAETLSYDSSGSSGRLASAVQKRYITATGLKDRGVKVRKDLIVLNTTNMPAILIEVGFLSNAEDRGRITQPAFWKVAAKAIADGLDDYLGISGKEVQTMTTVEAIEVLVKKGIINTPGYWEGACKCVKFLPELLVAVAKMI